MLQEGHARGGSASRMDRVTWLCTEEAMGKVGLPGEWARIRKTHRWPEGRDRANPSAPADIVFSFWWEKGKKREKR